MTRIILVLSIIASLSAATCDKKNVHGKLPAKTGNTVTILTPGQAAIEVTVELALTPEEQRHGLMDRERLDPLHGMLFIFQDEEQRTFWMKNTLIELDMIFIRSNKEILGCVERAIPMTTTLREIQGNSKYVLEVPGGFCREHRIGSSTKFQFYINSTNAAQ